MGRTFSGTPVTLPALALLYTVSAYASPQNFAIPSQPLSQTIQQIGRTGNLHVVVDEKLLAGKSAPAVSGTMEPLAALRQALKDTDLTASAAGDGSLVVESLPAAASASGAGTLPPVVVTAQKPAEEGSAEVGYKPETARTTGPWGAMPIKDTPYSISVTPSELLENWVASSPDQVLMMAPGTQLREPINYGDTQVFNIRGFLPSMAFLDGVRIGLNGTVSSLPLEEMDRIEILSGVTGFLYGGGTPGGAVNYVLKRPTATRLADFTIGNYGGSQYFAHADLGGPIDHDGKLSYRLNLVGQPEGGTNIENQRTRRDVISGALDWHVTDRLLVQLEAGHIDRTIDGLLPYFTVPTGVSYSDFKLPSGNKLFDQPWTHREITTNHAGVDLTWQATDALTFRAGYLYKRDDYSSALYNCGSNFNTNGTYSQTICKIAPQQYDYQGMYALADANFNTWFLEHKVTFGYSADFAREYVHGDNFASTTINGLTFANPYVPELSFPELGLQPTYLLLRNYYKNLQLGDEITITPQWSIMAGVNRTTILAINGNAAGDVTSNYDKSALTPTVSLIYKPSNWLTSYFTYMQALQNGGIVGNNYENAGQVFSPAISDQYEVGAKADVGGALVTGSLFRISEASTLTQFAHPTDKLQTQTQDGRQVNQGIELTVSGKPLPHFTLWGGLTALTARTEKTSTPALDGKTPIGTAEKMAKLYAEYETPLPGLILTAGVDLIGPTYADSANTNRIPGYGVANAGFRYETREFGKPLIFRLNVYNLANKRYWLGNAYVGNGRFAAFSLEAKL